MATVAKLGWWKSSWCIVLRPEQRVEWRVVAAVAKVEPTHEADDPLLPLGRHRRRHVVVRKHGGDLQVLHDAPGVVGVPGAHHAANVGALEVVHRLLIVRRHETFFSNPTDKGHSFASATATTISGILHANPCEGPKAAASFS